MTAPATRCRRCNRPLTDPTSRRHGMGPTCRRRPGHTTPHTPAGPTGPGQLDLLDAAMTVTDTPQESRITITIPEPDPKPLDPDRRPA